MAGYEGFATLGDIVTGGAARRAEKEYPTRLKQNFDAFDALNQAKISRAQAMAREAINGELVQRALGGDPAAQGELGAYTMQTATGQPNFGTYTKGLKDIGDLAIDRQRVEAAQSGNVDLMNRLTAVAGDKLMDRTRISGGMAYDPYAPPDQDMALTPIGDATVGVREAQAQAAVMRAGSAVTKDLAQAELAHARAGAASRVSVPGVSIDGGDPIPLPEGTSAGAAATLAALNDARRERGLPVLAPDEVAQKIEEYERTGQMTDGAGIGDKVTLQQGRANADALRIKADALRAIADGAPKKAVQDRLRKMGYPKIAQAL